MSVSRISGRSRRLNKTQKLAVAGVSTLAAAAVAFSLVPNDAYGHHEPQAAAPPRPSPTPARRRRGLKATGHRAEHDGRRRGPRPADAAKKKAASRRPPPRRRPAAKAVAEPPRRRPPRRLEGRTREAAKPFRQAASRAGRRKPVYANNLDGWIRESLAIMTTSRHPGYVQRPAPQHHPGVQRQPERDQQLGHQRPQRHPLQGSAPGHHADLRRVPRRRHVGEHLRPGRQHHRRRQLRGRQVRLDRQRQQRVLSPRRDGRIRAAAHTRR